MTSKLFYIYSVYKNYQILSLQLSSISRISQTISNKLINTHDCVVSGNNCFSFSCYLFRKLSLIIVENVSIKLFRVTTEWLHFRPYIHPIDHHFTKKKKKKKKKKKLGALAPPGHLPGPPGDLKLTSYPQLQSFLTLPKTDAPIFFWIAPRKQYERRCHYWNDVHLIITTYLKYKSPIHW